MSGTDSPVGEAITKVAAVEDEDVLARFNKVGGDLPGGPELEEEEGRAAPRDAGGSERTWSQPRVPEPEMMKGWASWVKRTCLIMRMQSPNTGMKSGETWDVDGWAFA